MIQFQLFMLVAILILASKDATSYKLKSKIDNDLTGIRVKRWHTLGAILNILLVLPFIYFDLPNWYLYIIYTVLIRLTLFDIGFNYWAGLDYKFLGSTAWWDQQFIKIFGEEGAIKKSIFFLIIFLLLNILL